MSDLQTVILPKDANGETAAGAGDFLNVTATTAGVAVKASPALLQRVVVGDPGTTVVISFYDSPSAASNPILTLKPTAAGTFECRIITQNGLWMVVTGTVGNFAVVYV